MQELLLHHLYMHTPFGWGGWGGWDDNVPWTCTHTRVRVVGGWVGWGGWDDNVPWTCTHSSLQIGRWGGRIGWAGQLVLHVCCDIYIRRFQQWGALWFQQFMRKTGRHLQLRNFTYNSVASTTTSFFCTTWSLLRTTLDPASCWLSQAYRDRECTSDRNPACTSDCSPIKKAWSFVYCK